MIQVEVDIAVLSSELAAANFESSSEAQGLIRAFGVLPGSYRPANSLGCY